MLIFYLRVMDRKKGTNDDKGKGKAREGNNDEKGKGNARDSARGPPPGRQQKICPFYLKGYCFRGLSCWDIHQDPQESTNERRESGSYLFLISVLVLAPNIS